MAGSVLLANAGADPRHGPLTKHEVKRLLSLGKLTMQTRFWAQGMLDAQPMEAIRELRWDVSGRGELHHQTPAPDTEETCLKMDPRITSRNASPYHMCLVEGFDQ